MEATMEKRTRILSVFLLIPFLIASFVLPSTARIIRSGHTTVHVSQNEIRTFKKMPIETDEELLLNGGFESGSFEPWYHEGAWYISTDNPHSGTYCAYDTSNNWLRQDFFPIPASDIVSATLWCRQPLEAIAAINFIYDDFTYSEDVIWPTSEWQQFDLTGFIDPGTVVIGIRVWGYETGFPTLLDETYYDDISIDDVALPNPITLSSFSASVSEETVTLQWETASEIDCYGWFVQRNEIDISPFIPGYGTTQEPHSYSYVDNSANFSQTYLYRLKQIDIDATVTYSDPITVVVGSETASAFNLIGNYPNPFNPTTVVSFELHDASLVHLTVYDLSGQKVADLLDGWRDTGVHEATFDGSGLASGVYLYRLTAGEFTDTGKMVLMK
ncbi:hypothetical protein CEE37_03625 [candidate division LCP-89 bacterium B3_LCP]|uniref:Secretion system C-terminal sorting domain-containing protein n=1 Tax=candidate division LCP-89 bacterium B3_LCP TaxID=2012998 RepID=A0A532V3F0_UNCL8|nr:MAG: hypothetical protein CEE37_03625 [candidate division LCP-89 bacterium B3_LCP]